MRKTKLKKFIVLTLVLAVTISQIAVVTFDEVHAAGVGNLEIRVQYDGEREDKIRTVASFSKSNLENIGRNTCYYSGITSIGTVMRSVAKGPKIVDVISAAGIDLKSVEYIVFRTSDGTGKDKRYSAKFSLGTINSQRWYYPNLYKNYIRNSEDEVITPTKGALSDAVGVPTILATESYSTKANTATVTPSKMTSTDSYRFFLGSPKLTEGQETNSSHVSSWDSIKWIFGIDVVLKGYPPVTGISLSVAKEDLTIGSSTQINAKISGGSGDVSDLTWASSNPDVATVSSSGMLTINGEGTTKITASADGVTASMTITVSSEEITKEIENPNFNPDEEEGEGNMRTITTTETVYNVDITYENGVAPEEKVITKPLKTTKAKVMKPVETTEKKESKKTISAKQVQLNKIQQEPRDGTTTQNVQALEAAEQYGPGTKALAGGVGFGVFALGAAMRYRRYRIDR